MLEEQVKQRHIVEFGTKSYFTKNVDSHLTTHHFNTSHNLLSTGNFNLLIDNLKNFETKKYNIFIFAENPKQLERLHTFSAT